MDEQEYKDPLKPHVEGNAAQNIPYRGSVDHGVPYKTFDAVSELWVDVNDGDVEEELDDHVIPVPVQVVNQGTHELKRLRAIRHYADGASVSRLVGPNDARTKLTIRTPTGGGILYIDSSESVSTFTGYPIFPGESLSVNSTDAVYCIFDNTVAAQAPIYALMEYSVGYK